MICLITKCMLSEWTNQIAQTRWLYLANTPKMWYDN